MASQPKSPYQCDFDCVDGFTKYNYTCLNCPPIPPYATITQGCSWTCPRGLLAQSDLCVQCPEPSCAIGSYVDYATTSSQCPECLPCSPLNLFPNSKFISTTGCDAGCLDSFYASASGTSNPNSNTISRVCLPCTAQRTCATNQCPIPCTDIADSKCGPCPTTTTAVPQTTAAPLQFASLLGVSIPTGSVLTLTQILASVASDSRCVVLCTAQIISVVDPSGNTIMCQNNTCPNLPNDAIAQYSGRRRLLGMWVINIGTISSIPLPTNAVISISQSVVTTYNTPVAASQVQHLISNPASLINFVNSYVPQTTKPATTPPPPVTSSPSSSAGTIVGVVFALLFVAFLCCFCMIMRRRRRAKRAQNAKRKRNTNNTPRRRPTDLESKCAITASTIHVRIQPYSPANTI